MSEANIESSSEITVEEQADQRIMRHIAICGVVAFAIAGCIAIAANTIA